LKAGGCLRGVARVSNIGPSLAVRTWAMPRGVTTAAVALAAGVLAWPALAAATTDLPEVTDAVPGHPGVTYLDLLRQAIPDLAMNAADKQVEGHLKSLRHIWGKQAEGDPPIRWSRISWRCAASRRPGARVWWCWSISGSRRTALRARR
jgi:hypothetical protein